MEQGAFEFDGRKCPIRSAGYFYNPRRDGYNIVLASSEIEVSSSLIWRPECDTLCIDIPGKCKGIPVQLVRCLDTDKWCFFMYFFMRGEASVYFEDEDFFSSGRMLFDLLEDGKMIVRMKALTSGGKEIVCSYSGIPSISSSYIFNWNGEEL